MNILFITDNFPPEHNAPASRTFEHAREWVGAGHRVTVITCAPNFPRGKVYPGYKNKLYQRETMAGIEVIRVWSYMSPNKGFLKRTLDYSSFMISSLLGALAVRKPDVVLATSPQFFAGIAGYLIGKLKRRVFILEVRDLWPEQILAVGAMKESFAVNQLFRLARFLYHHSDHVVTVGEGYAERITRDHHLPAENISIVPNGILPELFSNKAQDDALRHELSWEGRFVVLYLGTLGMSQNLDTILQAAALVQHDKKLLFCFVGDGAEKEKLLRRRESLGLDNCRFYPAIVKETVPRYYKAADVSIVALRKCDLFLSNYPSKMFESMAMECPIILSAGGKSEELLMRAGAGVAVPPENPDRIAEEIVALKKNPEKATAMGKAGRSFVLRHYNRKAWATEYLKLMERVRARPERTH